MSSASESEPEPELDAVSGADHNSRTLSRRRSSTSQSPRKRPRLRSTDSSRFRNHKVLRKPELEAKYNDNYRLLFNDQVAQATARFDVDVAKEEEQGFSKHVGSSVWLSQEQAVFFAALERLGPDDTPGIACAIRTKTAVEVRAFLVLLQDAATKQGDANLTLRDIPAAIEVGDSCHQELEEAGDALAWYQERQEALQEQERYGEHWLITPSIAQEIEDAYSGFIHLRAASAIQEDEPKEFGSGVAGACERCKTKKKKCDRQVPSCSNCGLSKFDCVYPDRTPRAANRSRTTNPQDREHQGYVNGIAGACVSCKKRKRKCDRRVPCTYCTQTKTECVYPQNEQRVLKPGLASNNLSVDTEGVNTRIDNTEQSRALERITEANLLDPKVMLTLSKEIFMNRSAELPSPWLHWSQYVTELASEPSIYRSAFSDFHRLALSVTKRLAQTAIIQATSRLRAQRVRGKKGLLPFVRKRDIHTAIDILGMRRNGKERWQGVARRCGFKVTSSQKTPKGRRTREVPWSEVESIMSSVVPPEEQPTQDAETSTERDKQEFKSRAVRNGTPLPMHNLTLSDAEDDEGIDSGDEDIGSEDEDISSEDEDICSDDERFTDDERQSLAHNSKQHRDVASRYTSVSPTTRADGALHQFDTLEAFDQEARQQEEHALWDMLGLVPIDHIHSTKTDDDVVSVESEMDREIPTEPENWRRSLDYKPVWETYDDAIPFVKFFKNQKRPSPMHTTRAAQFHSTTPPSDHIIDDSSTSGPKRPRRRVPGEVELQARGTNAYAALQRDEGSHEYNTGHTSSADNEELEEDFPTQSIEARQNAADFESPGSDMDWL